MARPVKYTPEVSQRIESAIAAGATYRLACGYAGISEATFSRWRKRYADFDEMLARVEASAALRWLARIEQAGTEDWRALAWKLERRFPAEYGKTVQAVEHSGPDGGRLTFTFTRPDDASEPTEALPDAEEGPTNGRLPG